MQMSEKLEMARELERRREMIEDTLGACFKEKVSYSELLESIRYSLLAGGKRIRAVLCLAFCNAAGGNETLALNAAAAVEMLHTYSLIHDDLPCMDNDDLRRGKPSNHKVYGEFTALLAGDALQAAAFGAVFRSALPPGIVVKMGNTLVDAASAQGICGGQLLDMRAEGKEKLPISALIEIHNMKTASLMTAAARLGILAADGTEEQLNAADEYALALGLAFQIRDDVLNYTATAEELGKPVGTDKERKKLSFATVLGLEKCECVIHEQTEKAINAIRGGLFRDTRFLIWLAQVLEERKY